MHRYLPNKVLQKSLTSTVSRFGRNTIDTLSYIRKLKGLGIDVYFEKENIHSLSADGELMLTLMAAFAESESKSLSENISWARRKKAAEGDINSIPFQNIYGYDKDKDDYVIIREDEASVVRRIFRDYMNGMNLQNITDALNHDGISTRKEGAVWHNKTVLNILENEKYCGDVIFQKYWNPEIAGHQKINNGELPKYYVEGAIPAIVDKELWSAAQIEYRRRAKGRKYQPDIDNPFSGRICCGLCGRPVVKCKIRCSKTDYITWWRCATKISRFKKGDDEDHEDLRVKDDRPKRVFVQAWNLIVSKRMMYEPRLRKARDNDPNALVRFNADRTLRLIDEVGKLKEFDYYFSMQTLDHMILQPSGKLTAVFLTGIKIAI